MPPATKIPPPPPVAEGARLTIKDVAERLNVDRRTVGQLIASGRLRFVRLGRVYRFREAWVEEFIDRAEGT